MKLTKQQQHNIIKNLSDKFDLILASPKDKLHIEEVAKLKNREDKIKDKEKQLSEFETELKAQKTLVDKKEAELDKKLETLKKKEAK